MKQIIQFPSAIEKITTRTDRTLKIELSTAELPAETEALILKMRQNQGFTVFAMEQIEEKDIPDINLDMEVGETKSPSQRLRNVIYVMWNENTDKKTPFDVYYKDKMEKIINQLKEKI